MTVLLKLLRLWYAVRAKVSWLLFGLLVCVELIVISGAAIFAGFLLNCRLLPGEISVTEPAEKEFSVDSARFTLRGISRNEKTDDYAMVKVSKGGQSSVYYVRDNFEEEIYLRFGSGEYTVEIFKLAEIARNDEIGGGISGAAAFGGAGWEMPVTHIKISVPISGIPSFLRNDLITLKVTNTSAEDGRWIYPSPMVQSGHPEIQEIARELVRKKTSDTQKVRAIHDYVIKTLIYDFDSLRPGQMKQQDALSVLHRRSAVCAGFSNLTAALCRAAGIPAKIIQSESMRHAWNNVYIDGKWKFLDVTWDNPVYRDARGIMRDSSARSTYFLLENLDGILSSKSRKPAMQYDHYDYTEKPE